MKLMIVLMMPLLMMAGDLSELNDNFKSKSSLTKWSRVHKDAKAPDQLQKLTYRSGWIQLTPYSSVWYKDYRGILLYKMIEGNFIVTTELKVSSRQGKRAPKSQYSLAGIMVRAPKKERENYIFLSLGAADKPGRFQFEVKTTRNSNSKLEISDAEGGHALLRIARIGKVMITMKKTTKEGWSIHQRYLRDDFPSKLQVGLTCYTDWRTCKTISVKQHNQSVIKHGNPDLKAAFNFVNFKRPELPEYLKGKDLMNPSEVSDQDLFTFLTGKGID